MSAITRAQTTVWLSHRQPISPISLTAIVNPFHSPTESLDKVAASRLVVLSVGFRSPRELGKFSPCMCYTRRVSVITVTVLPFDQMESSRSMQTRSGNLVHTPNWDGIFPTSELSFTRGFYE